MNRITVIGRLTKDPELRALPSGNSVCQLRLAVEGMGRGDRAQTGYINVAAYGKPGEAAARTLTTGWLVAVDGRLEYAEWSADDGQRRHDYHVVGDVQFLAAPRTSSEQEAPAAAAAAA